MLRRRRRRIDRLAHQAAQADEIARPRRTCATSPYLERPNRRGRWLTTTSVTRPPSWLAIAGRYRCMPGLQLQRLDHLGAKHLQRAAVVVQADAGDEAEQPVGDDRRHVAREEVVLPVLPPAAHDVVRRAPAPAAAGCRRDRSAGRRPSVTMKRPRAWANPAANAAVWPKLRVNRITRTRGSRAWTPPAARTSHPRCHRRRG